MGKVIFEIPFVEWCAELRAAPVARRGRPAGLRLSQEAYLHVMRELTRRPPEAAGVLLGPTDGLDVTRFVPDDTGRATRASFTFDHALLTEIVRAAAAEGLTCHGFAHSHPPGYRRLSDGDLMYVRSVFANPNNDIAEVLMPVVVDGQLLPFIVGRDGRVRTTTLTLI